MLSSIQSGSERGKAPDFFEYWESLGFFENLQIMLHPNFLILFNIARLIFTEDSTVDAYNAIDEITKEEQMYVPNRDESIQVNRIEKIAPVSDRMEIDTFRYIHEMRKTLPRELALEEGVFDMKLFTKTLLVQRYYETEADQFKPITTSKDPRGRDAKRFEQKFFILLDRSKSMEARMRTFYSKCLVAEFLRRKMNSKAKLFFRAFDSKPGPLYKIEKREDFPALIEEVLLTTTGGHSTNLRDAVLQAASDIRYDKEMLKSEILVVTDGISQIDKNELKLKLGDIRLNVLKIGGDLPILDYFELEAHLKREHIPVNAESVDLRRIYKELQVARENEEESTLSMAERRIYRSIFDRADKIMQDLKDISYKFIEVGDLRPDLVYQVGDEQLEAIREAANRLSAVNLDECEIADKKRLFRQLQFLQQYVHMLAAHSEESSAALEEIEKRLMGIKNRYLKDKHIIYSFVQVKELKDDKETMKLARKEARQMLKQMKLDNRKLSTREMKKAQLVFTMDVGGEGSMGQFLMLMFIKLFQQIKRLFLLPSRIASRRNKKDPRGRE